MKSKAAVVRLAMAAGSGVLLLGAHALWAQEAYSPAVGYVKVTIPAATDGTLALPLHRDTVYTGPVESIAGNVVTVPNAPFTASQLKYQAGTQPDTHYLLVKSGTLEGKWFEVLDNGTDTLTLDPDSQTQTVEQQGFAAADTFSVIPFWTLGTLFPDG